MSDLCQRAARGTIPTIRGIQTDACVLAQGWGQLMGRGTGRTVASLQWQKHGQIKHPPEES